MQNNQPAPVALCAARAEMSCLLVQKNLPEGLAFLPIRPTMKAAFRVPHLPSSPCFQVRNKLSSFGREIQRQYRVWQLRWTACALFWITPRRLPARLAGSHRAVGSVINFFFEHLIRKVSRELQPVRPQKGIRVEIPAISQSRALFFFLSVPYAMPTVVPSDGN